MPRSYHVYILTKRTRSTLYIGMTGNLPQRMEQHTSREVEGFTNKYNVDRLVYTEEFDNPMDAIRREKQLKAWKREWKDNLIDAANPTWRDLKDGKPSVNLEIPAFAGMTGGCLRRERRSQQKMAPQLSFPRRRESHLGGSVDK